MKPDPFIEKALNQDFYLSPLNSESHQENSFREQMGVLYLAGVDKTHVTLMRTFLTVGEPGAVSLDRDKPGQDTPEAWEELDYGIENHQVVGTFHTHRPYVFAFSTQDFRAQSGLAKANGSKLLWHGVQACSTEGVRVHGSCFVCCQMLGDRVFRYHYGHIDDSLRNPVIVLPLPPQIDWKDSSYDLSIPVSPASIADSAVEILPH